MIRPLLFKLFRRIITIVISFLLSNNIIITTPLRAQEWIDNDDLVIVKMRGGKERLGIIQYEDDVKILLQELNKDTISIEWADMKSVRAAGRVRLVNGKFWYENRYAANYFLGPSAIGLNKGEGFYQNSLILFNQVGYGLTKHISVRGFIIPIFYDQSPTGINVQYNFNYLPKNINIAIGTVYIKHNIFENFSSKPSSGIFYGMFTYGSREKHFTVGAGYGYNGEDESPFPMFTMAATYRISRKFYILTENYIFGIDGSYTFFGRKISNKFHNAAFSLGWRYTARKIALDLAIGNWVYNVFYLPELTPVPWVGLTIPFGRQ